MKSAAEALERLKRGNEEFVRGVHGESDTRTGTGTGTGTGTVLPQVQDPLAIILGCSDARVSPELVFNQGPGDLFVIRVIGNVVGPTQIGSIEYAAAEFGTPLIVVMGHSGCGAVLATLEELEHPGKNQSPNIGSVVDLVRPSIEGLLRSEARKDRDALVDHAVRANVMASVNHLRHGSELLSQLRSKSGLMVVGAKYSLRSGEVEFLPD